MILDPDACIYDAANLSRTDGRTNGQGDSGNRMYPGEAVPPGALAHMTMDIFDLTRRQQEKAGPPTIPQTHPQHSRDAWRVLHRHRHLWVFPKTSVEYLTNSKTIQQLIRENGRH